MTEFFAFFENLIFDYTLRTVALGSATVGIVSGTLGAFAVLRKQSLLGDVISHTALPGVALAFLLTSLKTPLLLIVGAAITGWMGTLMVMFIVSHSRIKSDSALGMVLSVFFGFGLVLLTFIQNKSNAGQAGLDVFLFGQASALLEEEVFVMMIIAAVILLLTAVFWKEFKLLSFDPEFGRSIGFRISLIDVILISLLVVAIVLGLQMVGVVLMSAMVVGPASAARQWSDRLSGMVVLSALFGGLSGVGGALISSHFEKMPTGPTIVVCLSLVVLVSLFLAPNRGLLWRLVRQHRNRRRLQLETVLGHLYELALYHDNPNRPHTLGTFRAMSLQPDSVAASLAELESRHLVRQPESGQWILTQRGLEIADKIAAGKETGI